MVKKAEKSGGDGEGESFFFFFPFLPKWRHHHFLQTFPSFPLFLFLNRIGGAGLSQKTESSLQCQYGFSIDFNERGVGVDSDPLLSFFC